MTSVLISVVAAIVVSFLICGALKGQLNNHHEASQAMHYLDDKSVKFSIRRDVYSHKTVDRQKINKN